MLTHTDPMVIVAGYLMLAAFVLIAWLWEVWMKDEE